MKVMLLMRELDSIRSSVTHLVTQAKRVLKPGGKFICLTLAESHVLGTSGDSNLSELFQS